MENNVIALTNQNQKEVEQSLNSWSSTNTPGNLVTTASNTVNCVIASPIDGNYTLPTYPNTWVTYQTNTDITNKILVTKAENGFVLVYNSKTYIAKNETEVAKLIVKVMSTDKKEK